MLEGIFRERSNTPEKRELSEVAKNLIEESRLVLLLKDDQRNLTRLPDYVRYAQEDCAEALKEGVAFETAKKSTVARFKLLDLPEHVSKQLTDAIYDS